MRTGVIGLAFLLLAAGSGSHAFKRTATGEPLKDFSLEALDGGTLRLSENLGGKATLVVFWAVWSPRSEEVLKDFQKLHEEHGPRDLRVIGVNVEHNVWEPGEEEKVASFVEQHGVTFPVVVDRDLSVFDRYGVIAVPSTVLVDAGGQIVALLEGYSYQTRFDFRDRVLTALGLAPAEPVAEEVETGYRPKGKAARHYQMGMLLLDRKMPTRALSAFRRAVEEDPDFADAYRRLAEIYEAEGMAAEAAEARSRATSLGGAPGPTPAEAPAAAVEPGAAPADTEARQAAVRYVRMGRMLLKRELTENALKIFQTAVEKDPAYREAHLGLADALEAAGRSQEAAEARARAASLETQGPTGPAGD